MPSESFLHNVKSLALSRHSLLAIETVEEDRVDHLLGALSSDQLWHYFDWSLASGLRNRTLNQTLVVPDELMDALGRIKDMAVPSIFWFRDLADHLRDPLICRFIRELIDDFHVSPITKVMIVSGATIDLPADLEHFATHVPMQLPDEGELEAIVNRTVTGLTKRLDFSIEINHQQKDQLVQALKGLTANQARQRITHAIVEDQSLSAEDINEVAHHRARTLRDGGLLEYCEVDGNSFRLGGFDKMLTWLERAQMGFSPEAAALNLKNPRGILLVGVQGCGKSLAAKVIAKEWQLPLLKLDASRLFDKYIGESEKNLYRAQKLAESLSPCVLWIDEVEKGFSTGGSDSTDGGVGRRMLGTFLTWMQEKKQPVFIVATANDVETLPPEFLRKGRFDEIFFVDLPNSEERRVILEIHIDLRNCDPAQFDIDSLTHATEGFSGAEIEQAIIAAAYESLYRKEPLSTGLILQEIGSTVPLSVSRREAVAKLRDYARGRFVPVTS